MSIFTQIASWIVAGAITVSGILGVIPSQRATDISLGSGATNFTPVQVPRTYLYGAGIGATDTSIKLTSLKTTNGQTVGMSAFGTIGYATIDAAIPNKEENISFSGITQNPDGTALLTGVTRGLLPFYPFTASSTYQVSHSGGASVIFSNSAPFYSQFAFWGTTTTITGNWTFTSSSIPSFDTISPSIFTNGAQIVSKNYVDSAVSAGAPPISTTTAGIGMLATIAQTASGTATSTYNGQTYSLVPQNKNFSTISNGTNSGVVTKSNGKIDDSFIDHTVSYIQSGNVTTTGAIVNTSSTTYTASSSVTFNGAINGIRNFISPFTAYANITAHQAVAMGSGNSTFAGIQTYNQSNTANAVSVGTSLTTWVAFDFTTPNFGVTSTLSTSSIYLSLGGGSCSLVSSTISIRLTSGGVPTGSDLVSTSSAQYNLIGCSGTLTFNLPYTLNPNTTYALIQRLQTTPGLGGFTYFGQYQSSDSGTSWSSVPLNNTPNNSFSYLYTPPSGTIVPATSYLSGSGLVFVGFANSDIAAGSSGYVTTNGVVSGLTNILAGSYYYLNDLLGTIGSSSGSQTRKVGIGLSSSTLLITNNW